MLQVRLYAGGLVDVDVPRDSGTIKAAISDIDDGSF